MLTRQLQRWLETRKRHRHERAPMTAKRLMTERVVSRKNPPDNAPPRMPIAFTG
jgi:hypothetical protein